MPLELQVRRGVGLRWAMTLGTVGAALGLTLSIPALRETHTLMLFMGAVLVCTWRAGFAAGLASMFLSLGAWAIWVVPPRGTFDDESFGVSHSVRGVAFLCVAGSSLLYSLPIRRRAWRLAQDRRKVHAALEAAGMGAFEYDARGGDFWASPELLRILGADAATWSPTFGGFLSFVSTADRDRVIRAMTCADGARGDFDLAMQAVRRDGTTCEVWLHGRMAVDADGHLRRVAGILSVIDVDQRPGTADAPATSGAFAQQAEKLGLVD
jgi:PAS domain-containing protein